MCVHTCMQMYILYLFGASTLIDGKPESGQSNRHTHTRQAHESVASLRANSLISQQECHPSMRR